eukprot:c394_g1_i1.p1 GENE.c394_g1_i1~~c394_g1_i1.p1  ORF type:complete len:268 (-),score=81.76 c394_g1_i1:62-811(-)
MSRTPIVGGNWKNNGSRATIKTLVETLNAADLPFNVQVVVFPPSIYLDYTKSLIKDSILVGAQNSYIKSGAFTGEIDPVMIKDSGYDWTILGHSERRHVVVHESEEELGQKLRAAINAGLNVVYCIGEKLDEREANKTRDVVFHQLETVKKTLSAAEWEKVVVAYEPVWAIGTGKVATPEQAQEVHSWIRGWVSEHVSAEVAAALRIQYGGSVKGSNSAELSGQPDIDGFLVGGAALTADFVTIVKSFA